MDKTVWIGSLSGNNRKSKIQHLKFAVVVGAMLLALRSRYEIT